MWSTLAGSLISLAVVCQAAALDCACDAFANGAHPRNRRLCQKKEAGKDVCRPRDDSGNCPSDQDECKGRSHNSLPVCDGCTFRNGGRPYDEYNCFNGQEGDTTWCVPTDSVGICEACVSCDTSSCDSESSRGSCRREKLWDCCMAEKECGDDDHSCYFDCCETVEIGRGDCLDMYYKCDTSDCDTSACKREKRQGCCTAEKGCSSLTSADDRNNCYFECCEDVGLGDCQPPGFALACVNGMTCPVKGRSPGPSISKTEYTTMMQCWQDCLAEERCVGAISHSNGDCYLLARTYDENFEEVVCGTWVSNKDPAAICGGCDTSLESPEACPTP